MKEKGKEALQEKNFLENVGIFLKVRGYCIFKTNNYAFEKQYSHKTMKSS